VKSLLNLLFIGDIVLHINMSDSQGMHMEKTKSLVQYYNV